MNPTIRHAPAASRRLTDEERALRSVTEAQFLEQVIDLAHVFGYRVAHFRPAWSGRGYRTPVQGDGAGFPDLILVGRGRVIAAELKRETTQATPDQLAWLTAFTEAGIATYVWRPRDLERIAEVLRR
jgi:hypothetical protein